MASESRSASPSPSRAAAKPTDRLAGDIYRLSAGLVRRISPSGPLLAHRKGPSRRRSRQTFEPALSDSDRLAMLVLSVGWLTCLAAFWVWWLEPTHRLGYFGLVVNSAVLIYVSGFPVFFVASANRLHKVAASLPVAPLRTAFVVTRAPSEPWDVAQATLTAMLAQDYPFGYDVWLCDERPTPEILAWCRQHDVSVSNRHGVSSYHRSSWPRRTRCKEGNLAYFYDRVGYRSYEVVAQLDCDQVPAPSYLREMIRPFTDPAVGYVAAPSMCDSNAAESWSARGRVYREATFHGAFQLGHSDGYGPLCIGSHYAVRTAALRDIGGIGPDLAEDFSTSFLLNAAGWDGVFAIDAEAHGVGPGTFQAMCRQEFQWARSLTTILVGLVPPNLGRLSWRLRVRFLYALSYYVLLSGTTLVGLALAPVAAITGQPWVSISYLGFLAHIWSVAIWLIIMTILLRSRGLLRPVGAPILSWESWMYALSRWPYVGLGVGAALANRVWPRDVTFALTPKARPGFEPLGTRPVLPFVAISLTAAGAALYGEHFTGAAGYVLLSILEAIAYAVLSIAVPLLHASEIAAAAGVSQRHAVRRAVSAPLSWGVLAAAVTTLAMVRYPGYAIRLFGW